jgi:hypothetical protein
LRHLDEVFTILVILVPKVSEALWERSSRRDSVSVASHDDFKRRPNAHPPPTETEFRLTDPFPKRFANFGNESEKAPVILVGEDRFPAIASRHDMVKGSRIFDADTARHGGHPTAADAALSRNVA